MKLPRSTAVRRFMMELQDVPMVVEHVKAQDDPIMQLTDAKSRLLHAGRQRQQDAHDGDHEAELNRVAFGDAPTLAFLQLCALEQCHPQICWLAHYDELMNNGTCSDDGSEGDGVGGDDSIVSQRSDGDEFEASEVVARETEMRDLAAESAESDATLDEGVYDHLDRRTMVDTDASGSSSHTTDSAALANEQWAALAAGSAEASDDVHGDQAAESSFAHSASGTSIATVVEGATESHAESVPDLQGALSRESGTEPAGAAAVSEGGAAGALPEYNAADARLGARFRRERLMLAQDQRADVVGKKGVRAAAGELIDKRWVKLRWAADADGVLSVVPPSTGASTADATDSDGVHDDGRRVFVPAVAGRRRAMLASAHNVGHVSAPKMTELISRHYYWPTLTADAAEFVRKCLRCQQAERPALDVHLGSWPAARRFARVHMDLMPMPPARNTVDGLVYKTVLVLRDARTGAMEAVPLVDGTAAHVWQAVLSRWIVVRGPPRIIVSDGGRQLIGKKMRTECAKSSGASNSYQYRRKTSKRTDKPSPA